MAKITVYSTEPCSFCERAKQLLRIRKLEFVEINLAKDPAGRAQLVEETGMLSFPQIVIGDVVRGRLPAARAGRPERPPGRAHRAGRLARRRRGRGWQLSHAYVPRPAATNLTTGAAHRGHGSPRRQVDEELVLEGAPDAVDVAEVVDRRAARRDAGCQRLAHRDAPARRTAPG